MYLYIYFSTHFVGLLLKIKHLQAAVYSQPFDRSIVIH